MIHPLPWNESSGTGVGNDFGHIPNYPGGYHSGIDMHAPRGEGVLAAASGIVVYADDTGGDYGNRVDICHGDHLYTVYAHLDEIYVVAGDMAPEGDEIGSCGSSGNSNGYHLHFEVRKGGNSKENCVDPMAYIQPKPSYFSQANLRTD